MLLIYLFCQYVVDDRQLLVIFDVMMNELVWDNLVIFDLGVIFYMGVFVILLGGMVIGVFVMIDSCLRVWIIEQVEFFGKFGKFVFNQIVMFLFESRWMVVFE